MLLSFAACTAQTTDITEAVQATEQVTPEATEAPTPKSTAEPTPEPTPIPEPTMSPEEIREQEIMDIVMDYKRYYDKYDDFGAREALKKMVDKGDIAMGVVNAVVGNVSYLSEQDWASEMKLYDMYFRVASGYEYDEREADTFVRCCRGSADYGSLCISYLDTKEKRDRVEKVVLAILEWDESTTDENRMVMEELIFDESLTPGEVIIIIEWFWNRAGFPQKIVVGDIIYGPNEYYHDVKEHGISIAGRRLDAYYELLENAVGE